MAVTLFAALTVIGIAGPLRWIVAARFRRRRDRVIVLAAAAAIGATALLVGPWAMVSVHLRPAAALLLAVSLAVAARRPADPAAPALSHLRARLYAACACVFAVVTANAVAGHRRPPDARELEFPLEGGVFAVVQGGGSIALNPFHRWFPSQRYALDLVRLNDYGNRAAGVAPSRLSDYASFGVPVRSPCTGTAVAVEAGLPDNRPGGVDAEHRAGNELVIQCGDLRVLLGHFARGSIGIAAGDRVHAGQVVGRIGNSGYSNEPHLHLSAVRVHPGGAQVAVPMTFAGRFLVMNDLVPR